MEHSKDPKSELTPFKEPTPEMQKYYANLYERNQSKWIRRSQLGVEHLGSTFEHDGGIFTLVGTIDPVLMLVREESGKYYKIHCDIVTKKILGS
jgi:hypothetical protein